MKKNERSMSFTVYMIHELANEQGIVMAQAGANTVTGISNGFLNVPKTGR